MEFHQFNCNFQFYYVYINFKINNNYNVAVICPKGIDRYLTNQNIAKEICRINP